MKGTMKPITLILLWGILAFSILMGMHYIYDSERKVVCETQELPQGAIGTSIYGGYIYQSDFIGALNKNDLRAE